MKSYRYLVLILLVQGCVLLNSGKKYELLGVSWVPVPGGTYQMGDFHEAKNEDALPVHTVNVSSFSLSAYEITYEQYDAFATKNNRRLPEDDGYIRKARAVTHVSWDDANDFCRSIGARLPTEEEWEYAAREGGKSILYAGTNFLDSLALYARYRKNSVGYGSLVGQKRPNDIGLFDMSGNVAEWVGDFYQFYPNNGESPRFADMEASSIRIARGGSFHHSEQILRTYWRTGTLREISSFTIGFRCAK